MKNVDLTNKCGSCVWASKPFKFSQQGLPTYIKCNFIKNGVPKNVTHQRTQKCCLKYEKLPNYVFEE